MNQKYISQPSSKNNIGVSYTSQEAADLQALKMDESNCNYCTNCDNCTNCNYCYNCDNCSYCDNCNYCYNCDNCDNCSYCNNCDNCHIQPIQIQGLQWPVTIKNKTHIKIGCQEHSIKFWRTVSDETITKMDKNAPEFWNKYKTMILALAESIL